MSALELVISKDLVVLYVPDAPYVQHDNLVAISVLICARNTWEYLESRTKGGAKTVRIRSKWLGNGRPVRQFLPFPSHFERSQTVLGFPLVSDFRYS